MKTKQKKYMIGKDSDTYRATDFLGHASNTANNNLSNKNSHSGILQILGVNELVFGIKDRNNQRAKMEYDHDLDLNQISENGSIAVYIVVAVTIAAILVFSFFRTKK